MLLMTEVCLMFKAIKESFHIITIIVISFILLCVLIIPTLIAALAKIGAA